MSNDIESKINAIRDEIDKLDIELINLLNTRFNLVKKVGEIKVKNNAIMYRPQREKDIIEKLLNYSQKHNLENLTKARLESIFYEIFAVALNIEKPLEIAFLGPMGSFCHQAAEARFAPVSKYLPVSTISAVFDALKNNHAKYGVVPLENNTNGMVGECIDNLAKSNLSIVSEVVLDIHHSFASFANDINEIETIYSKDIAFGQCRDFLSNYNLHSVKQVATNSTAHAAQLASLDSKSAAICSSVAANLYRLPIMFDKIETNMNNKTRFVVISDFTNPQAKNHKTSVFVIIKDFQKSGSLVDLLQDFKNENINITKIDSRPLNSESGFRSGFYMDFYGHRYDDNIDRLFQKRGDEIKWLGSYPVF